jgi:hypothetical protein
MEDPPMMLEREMTAGATRGAEDGAELRTGRSLRGRRREAGRPESGYRTLIVAAACAVRRQPEWAVKRANPPKR